MVIPTQNPDETSNLNLAWYHLKSLKTITQKGTWPTELSASDRKNLRKQGLVQNHYISQKGWYPQITPMGLNILKQILSQNLTDSYSITKVIQTKTVK